MDDGAHATHTHTETLDLLAVIGVDADHGFAAIDAVGVADLGAFGNVFLTTSKASDLTVAFLEHFAFFFCPSRGRAKQTQP